MVKILTKRTMKETKYILLTLDVEEFDTPLNHSISLIEKHQLEVGYEGLMNVYNMLSTYKNIQSTFYTTANFAQHYPKIIKEISQHNEIASHTYFHSSFIPDHLVQSKEVLESIIKKKVFGIRMPNMKRIDSLLISNAGYIYDSSINPTYLPTKYNNLSKPIVPYFDNQLLEVPASVSTFMRIPLFWLTFKNMPLSVYLNLCKSTFKKTDVLNLYFHPWEFADLSGFKIPSYIKNPHGKPLLNKLENMIDFMMNIYDVKFVTTIDYLQKKGLVLTSESLKEPSYV